MPSIKPLVARERPSIRADCAAARPATLPRTFSFPSGHAASTFGAAVAVSRMWPQTRAGVVDHSRVLDRLLADLSRATTTRSMCIGGALLGIALAFWVLGGRHRATYASTLPKPLPPAWSSGLDTL